MPAEKEGPDEKDKPAPTQILQEATPEEEVALLASGVIETLEKEGEPAEESPPVDLASLKPVERLMALRKKNRKEYVRTIKAESRVSIYLKRFLKTFDGLVSPDYGTRRMTALLILSCFGMFFVFVASIFQAIENYQARVRANIVLPKEVDGGLEEVKNRESRKFDAAKRADTELNLGKFTIELEHEPNQVSLMGVVDLATIEIAILCNSRETRDFIKEHLLQARDQITSMFTTIHRKELMSREGKRKMNIVILRRLNHWLRRDGVTEVYFSNVIVN